MIKPLEQVLQPDPDKTAEANPQYVNSQRYLAALVGLVAMGLPILLWLSQSPENPLRDTISHYYYAPLWGDVFIGALFFIGGFLICYQGQNKWESWAAFPAGVGAFGVALFPTDGDGCEMCESRFRAFIEYIDRDGSGSADELIATNAFEFFPLSATIHAWAAGIVFGYLAFHTLIIFTRFQKSDFNEDGTVKIAKRIRNLIYITSGLVIIASIIAIVAKQFAADTSLWNEKNLTFIFEAVILVLFGFSWLVKGRFFFGFLDNK